MMCSPLASILITVYNREQYLATAIESALAQTLKDIEIIVLDDCSTDSSWQIAQKYADHPHVRLYRNEVNLRQFPTRNQIASLARGKYLKYLDSDDALLPQCMEMMVHMMEQHPEAGMLLWSSEGDGWYPFVLQSKEIYRRRFINGQRLERAPLSTLLRRDAFERVGGFSLDFPLCADMELIYRFARHYPALYGPHGLVFYRIHEGQVISTTSDGAFKHSFEEYRILLDALRHPDCPLPTDEKAWHLARIIYGAVRKSLNLAFAQKRWKTAWSFWRTLDISLAEMLPALRKPPVFPKQTCLARPSWNDFPPTVTSVATSSSLVSLIVVPGDDRDQLSLCLESLRHQRMSEIEVMIALPSRQKSLAAVVQSLGDSRFRYIEVLDEAGPLDCFNQLALLARGAYCKFIGPDCPLLYPYALEIEVAILGKRIDHPCVCSGRAAFTLGGLALTPREALALDAGTGGAFLRVDPSCVLFRRMALGEQFFDTGEGHWAFVALLYRLASKSGIVLGPHGLSTGWLREGVVPSGELPMQIKRQVLDNSLFGCVDGTQLDWSELVAEGQCLAPAVMERCQWDDPSWVLADTRVVG